MTKATTFRALIALKSLHGLLVHQMEVKMTFINGELEQKIYMRWNKGKKVLGEEHKACKL